LQVRGRRRLQYALQRGVVRALVVAGTGEVRELVALQLLRVDRAGVEVDREQLGGRGELRDVGIGGGGAERRALGEAEDRAGGDEGEAAPGAPGEELRAGGAFHRKTSWSVGVGSTLVRPWHRTGSSLHPNQRGMLNSGMPRALAHLSDEA